MVLGLGFLRFSAKVKPPLLSLQRFVFGPSYVVGSRNLGSCYESQKKNINQLMLYAKPTNILSKELFKLPSLNNRTFELPTVTRNLPMIAYIDQLAVLERIDPIVINKVISENEVVIRKEAAKMIQIRKRKMRKHKLKKFRKKFKFVIEKIKYKREKMKEKAFQAELLAQIKEAEVFNAEKYVHDVLKTIRERPKPETPEQRFERIRELRIKNRSSVNIIRPKFDED